MLSSAIAAPAAAGARESVGDRGEGRPNSNLELVLPEPTGWSGSVASIISNEDTHRCGKVLGRMGRLALADRLDKRLKNPRVAKQR